MADKQFFVFNAVAGEVTQTASGKEYRKFYTFNKSYILIKRDYDGGCAEGEYAKVTCTPAVYEGKPYFQFSVQRA